MSVTEPHDEDAAAPAAINSFRRGILLAISSAVAYSAANLALRGLSGRHDGLAWAIWVSAMKALPTVVVATFLLGWRAKQRKALFPSTGILPLLFVSALVMQFGGNLGFQVALGYIGLAITVPLVFAFIICAGAVMGRMFLGDQVSARTVLSMVIMTLAIVLLSWAATLNTSSVTANATSSATKNIWMGIFVAVVSGMSYGINGVVIRGIGRGKLPIESMLIVYSLTGAILLGTLGGTMLGTERLLAISMAEWQMMLTAGAFNSIAFFSISHALKLANVTQVNLINASQNAMCAIGAVLIFAEPLSLPMVAGIVLSIVGLFALDKK
ncbi:MAG: DMT family transporter [Fuerstiella sp.]|nr:DMT family transporter [Fuerstiella sp.]